MHHWSHAYIKSLLVAQNRWHFFFGICLFIIILSWLVFNHFLPIKNETFPRIFKAVCKHCKSEVSIKSKSTSNLITHLKVSQVQACRSTFWKTYVHKEQWTNLITFVITLKCILIINEQVMQWVIVIVIDCNWLHTVVWS